MCTNRQSTNTHVPSALSRNQDPEKVPLAYGSPSYHPGVPTCPPYLPDGTGELSCKDSAASPFDANCEDYEKLKIRQTRWAIFHALGVVLLCFIMLLTITHQADLFDVISPPDHSFGAVSDGSMCAKLASLAWEPQPHDGKEPKISFVNTQILDFSPASSIFMHINPDVHSHVVIRESNHTADFGAESFAPEPQVIVVLETAISLAAPLESIHRQRRDAIPVPVAPRMHICRESWTSDGQSYEGIAVSDDNPKFTTQSPRADDIDSHNQDQEVRFNVTIFVPSCLKPTPMSGEDHEGCATVRVPGMDVQVQCGDIEMNTPRVQYGHLDLSTHHGDVHSDGTHRAW